MNDLISRQAAIDVADAVWSVTGDKNVAKVWDQIKDLPSAQPKQQWIPVSERLPEEDGYYLTYGGWPNGYLILAFKHIRNWKKGHFFIAPFWNSPSEIVDRAVIAWMPLPEPYKGEDHEQN